MAHYTALHNTLLYIDIPTRWFTAKQRVLIRKPQGGDQESVGMYVRERAGMSGIGRKTTRYFDLIFFTQHFGDPHSDMVNALFQNGQQYGRYGR